MMFLALKSLYLLIGVLYGFGSEEGAKQAGADRIAASVEEVYDIVIEL